MKKLFTLVLFATFSIACKKNQTGRLATQGNNITGRWNIITVTVVPHDSTGAAINNGTIYTEPIYYYFQFNADLTWLENLAAEPGPALGESGTYVLHADTSFTLINANAPSKATECKIASLTDTSLTFNYQRATLFNGVTPGYLEYIFQLKK
jgi:hypothetical protein